MADPGGNLSSLDLDPGEHQVLDGVGVGVALTWALVSNKPFEWETRGVRLIKVWFIPIPSPFNSGWRQARKDWPQPGLYGIDGWDSPLPTFFAHVRVHQKQQLWRSANWEGFDFTKLRFHFSLENFFVFMSSFLLPFPLIFFFYLTAP